MKMLHDAYELLDDLTKEALCMTGDALLDAVRIDRGLSYVQSFQKAFPQFADFIAMILSGTPELMLASLASWQPSVNDWTPRQTKLAKQFLAEVQKRLKNER
jgi:hypothetical protein